MPSNLFTDIACKQQNCGTERICGDTFFYKRMHGGDRSIIVLSDGMGHGVKANVLSTLTASMIINFDYSCDDIRKMAEMVLKSLPVCSVRKISYSTFSIVDINHKTRDAVIIEFDNPQCLIYRDGSELKCDWECVMIENNERPRPATILYTTFKIKESDRIVVMSDGVTQSGLGSEKYPFGWGRPAVAAYIARLLKANPLASSTYLATKILGESIRNDNYCTKDDVSCVVVGVRPSKRLLLCSCPPSHPDMNQELVDYISSFVGLKVICGYHLAQLVSKISGKSITKERLSPDPDVQPAWRMEGVSLISESLVTLNKIYEMLQNKEAFTIDVGAAADIYNMLISSDDIEMLIGACKGNGGIYMVDEYELRRKVLRYIARLLEKKYSKVVAIKYL